MAHPIIILLTDYGTGDPSFIEVDLQLRMLIPEAVILPQSVPAFSTLATGFWIYQISLTPNLQNTFIFSNTAPRIDDEKAQVNNRGERLMYAKLTNGFEILGVNSKYCFSFVKKHIQAFHKVNVANEGSQFRSRDLYPQMVAKMIAKDKTLLGEAVNISSIPDFPKQSIVFVDGYGNLKTSVRASEVSYKPGQKLAITLNDHTHIVYFTDGIFNIPTGQIAFAPGSSGHEDRFMEIFYRGGNTAALFGNARVEQTFTITPI
jgi:S-adenosylmethionine hydrolase